MTQPKLSIHGRLMELADATRCRLLFALEEQELTVGELSAALQLPQSTVSRHLRILSDEGWVESRAEGASRFYRRMPELDEEADALWALVRGPLAATHGARQDQARIASVVAQRRTRSAAFFAYAAGEWDAMRENMFGARADLTAALALIDTRLVVGDLGCGTGVLTAALAPFCTHVHAIDASPEMLHAARERLTASRNVSIAQGTLESLPLPNESIDAAIMSLVLHHVPEPVAAFAEVRRVLRPDGRVIITDMQRHDREEYRQQMGHHWLGFDEQQLRGWLGEAGFDRFRHVPLPVAAGSTGPALFTMVARS